MDAIYTRGWVIVDDFLTATEVEALRACLPGDWQPAGIGREALHQGNPDIRRDQIHWLEADLGAPVVDYLARMESLRLAANRSLMLGLFDYEAHFARYRSGDFYATHRDAFAGRSNRRLTSVFYLNNGWQPEAGGVLRVYDNDEQFLMDVSPKGGRLVLFLSEEFPHEVLPARLVQGQRQRRRAGRSASLIETARPFLTQGLPQSTPLWPQAGEEGFHRLTRLCLPCYTGRTQCSYLASSGFFSCGGSSRIMTKPLLPRDHI